jgi:hypothetical protein
VEYYILPYLAGDSQSYDRDNATLWRPWLGKTESEVRLRLTFDFSSTSARVRR